MPQRQRRQPNIEPSSVVPAMNESGTQPASVVESEALKVATRMDLGNVLENVNRKNRESSVHLGDLYYAGDGTMVKEPDYRMAAKLYLQGGARDKFMQAANLMYQDMGRRYSAQDVAATYKAAGDVGKLRELAQRYVAIATEDPTYCRCAIEFLDAAGDIDGLVKLGDTFANTPSAKSGDFSVEIYKRAKADVKLIELGDNFLQAGSLVSAFNAYRAVTGGLPEQTVKKLIDLAHRLAKSSYRQNQEAVEALTIAKAQNELTALGEELVSNGVYLYAIRAFAAAGAVDRLLALGEELASAVASDSGADTANAAHNAYEAIATATSLLTTSMAS